MSFVNVVAASITNGLWPPTVVASSLPKEAVDDSDILMCPLPVIFVNSNWPLRILLPVPSFLVTLVEKLPLSDLSADILEVIAVTLVEKLPLSDCKASTLASSVVNLVEILELSAVIRVEKLELSAVILVEKLELSAVILVENEAESTCRASTLASSVLNLVCIELDNTFKLGTDMPETLRLPNEPVEVAEPLIIWFAIGNSIVPLSRLSFNTSTPVASFSCRLNLNPLSLLPASSFTIENP